MKILLPIDGIVDANLITDFVLKYQWPDPVEFKILHVIGSNDDETQAVKAENAAHLLLEAFARQLKSALPLATITLETRFGSPIYEIVDLALGWKCQMIVMGYRTRESITPFFTGSVATGVATVAPCSVAIIRPESAENTAPSAWEHALNTMGNHCRTTTSIRSRVDRVDETLY